MGSMEGGFGLVLTKEPWEFLIPWEFSWEFPWEFLCHDFSPTVFQDAQLTQLIYENLPAIPRGPGSWV